MKDATRTFRSCPGIPVKEMFFLLERFAIRCLVGQPLVNRGCWLLDFSSAHSSGAPPPPPQLPDRASSVRPRGELFRGVAGRSYPSLKTTRALGWPLTRPQRSELYKLAVKFNYLVQLVFVVVVVVEGRGAAF